MDIKPPRLMLFTPKIADAAAFAAPLGAAMAAGDVAAVVLDLADADERSLVNAVKRLAPVVQGRDSALLIADHPQIVARGGADGLHLSQPVGLGAAFDLLRDQDRIVGAGGMRLRDDAMTAAETGVDYVMFGDRRGDGSFPPLDSVVERAIWWAGIFEVPCVAFAPELDAIDDLARTGAEFIALGEPVWTHPDGPAAIVRSALQRLASRTHA
jgi:thiamine-phosphate pyrophosphorylase